MAFLVCCDFDGEGGLRKRGLGGTHPLMRRYTNGGNRAAIRVTGSKI